MTLKLYSCPNCGFEKESFKDLSKDECPQKIDEECAFLSPKISCPSSKFMVKVNSATNKSKLKDSDKMLKERSRNHSRDVDLDDVIQLNKTNSFAVSNNFLNEKGERRKKIDDI
ncbi:MAG: hypothetical protein MOGMAGMI_00359 [Candidatus Omnitrophica bacterium]|nr:hypothetical protein [Candidatus Omnitrophota bacterium]